jgi:NAD(P)-dependent dehydrogenase (short-subunit alcohol dehydrogenase family)
VDDHDGVLPPLFELTGRVALVTGASRGIGATAARALDAAGARVVLCARDEDRLTAVAAGLRHEPLVVPADLTAPGGVGELLAALDGALDVDVDILVNNAGGHAPAAATELALSDWDRVQLLNVRAVFELTRGLAPGMAARGWGKVVNVSSILGALGDTHAAAYTTSKAALTGLTRALGVEWAPHGITVNALCPGWIATDLVAGLAANSSFDRRVRRRTPAGRWATADDLVGAFLFLAGPASDFMTGQTLVVDGGLSASW